MLTRNDVEKRMRWVLEVMQSEVARGEEWPPVIIVDNGVVPETISAPMGDEFEKDMLSNIIIPSIIRERKPQLIMLATDGWRKDATNTHRIGEVLTVIAKSKYGIWGAVYEYTRDGSNKPVFGDAVFSTEGIKSRFFREQTKEGE